MDKEARAQKRSRGRSLVELYNEVRPHEALGMDTPAEHYQRSQRTMPAKMPEPDYPAEAAVRRVRQNGEIKWNGGFVYVSQTLAGEAVAVTETDHGEWLLSFYAQPLGILDSANMRLVRRSAAQPRPACAAADDPAGREL
jgi:putative transposase